MPDRPPQGVRAGSGGSVEIGGAHARQRLFRQGMLEMHSFQYEEAAQAFDEAVREDSRCAMCHWGKAMVLYQQIWRWPTADEMAAGLQEIRLAQQTGARTPRENAYIGAAEEFFKGPAGASHASRVAAYSRRVERLHQDHPADVDAAAFHALSAIRWACSRQ